MVVAWVVASALLASGALADEKGNCADGYEKSQTLRDDGNLIESRQQLRICARAECPDSVAKTCADWLTQLEQRIPSVVLSARNSVGAELIDVRVTVDGADLARRLDGRSVEVDPGVHTFVFEGAEGRVEQKFVVKQGARDQALAVAFDKPPSQIVVPLVASAGASDPAPSLPTNPLRYVGYAAGGLGLVGLGLGVVFGLRANSKFDESKEDPNGGGCDANDFCGSKGKEARGDAQSAGTFSTVGFIAGGVLLAGGVALVLLAPSESRSRALTAKVTAMTGRSAGGMMVGGTFQ